MKKSVIITIAVVYIFAIVVVGFIRIKIKAYNTPEFVTDITCVSDNFHKYDPNNPVHKKEMEKTKNLIGYIEEEFKEGLKITINCQVTPDNATKKALTFSVDENPAAYKLTPTSDGSATIEFFVGTEVIVTIKSTDIKGYSIKIKVTAFERNW